jgi:hypothetical protein
MTTEHKCDGRYSRMANGLKTGAAINDQMQTGQQVLCNGHKGTVVKICDGQLKGMVEVRLNSGVVCVDATEVRAV